MRVFSAQNLAIVACSVGISIVAGEAALRLVLDEVDYLRPTITRHAELGHTVLPGSAGHDEWGFRNPSVPDEVTILAVGDSQTYGFSAARTQSWPAVLADVSGETTYNLAQGGYGPREYELLVRDKAKRLSPRIVVVGFYLGNDLTDHSEINPVLFTDEPSDRPFDGLRDYLSAHSLTYQVVKLQGSAIVNRLRFEESVANLTHGSYVLDAAGLTTVLTPNLRFATLDQSDASIRGGIQRTKDHFAGIQRECDAIESRCVFALIPTKESVYWPVASQALTDQALADTAKMVAEEDLVRTQIVDFLEGGGFEYVDVLDAMRQAAGARNLYPRSHDGHPTGEGYRVIAEETWRYLSENGVLAASAPDTETTRPGS